MHRATNREGFPPGTSNPKEVECRSKAVLIQRSFETAAVVPGAVAGCLEFPDRVVYTTMCGTAPSDCYSTKCTGCTVLYKAIGNHTWCLPQYTNPRLYEMIKTPSRGTCDSNNLPSTLRAAWKYGYTAAVTDYHNFTSAPRKTPRECNALSPEATESMWTFPQTRNAELSTLGLKNARLPTAGRCGLDPYFDDGGGTCISLTVDLALSKSTNEMRAAWSCYSPYLRYLGISCPTGQESGSVDVKVLHDAAMKSEGLDEVFASLTQFLQNRTVTPLSIPNRTQARILQQLAHLPPKIDYKCCRGDRCNAPTKDVGACFVSELTLDIVEATSGGTLPGHVQSVARGCTHEVPGVMSGTCVTFEQKIFGRVQTTGMCYSDLYHAGYSAMDWIGIKVDCSTNSSAEGEMYFFDNIPNTTDGISQPPPKTGYVQQVAGTAGARFEYMKSAQDPVARPTYRKIEEASKVKFQCCNGLLCNTQAQPEADTILNYTSNITAIITFDGFQSPRSGRDFLIQYAQEFRERVSRALQPSFPRVSFSDVILTSICSSVDGCRMLLSYPCKDDKCRNADWKREQRRQLLESLPVSNVSIVVDFQVNLNASDNASHAALLLNTSNFKADLVAAFSEKANASLELEYLFGPLPLVQLSSASTRTGWSGRMRWLGSSMAVFISVLRVLSWQAW
jgi:hypothetical protein